MKPVPFIYGRHEMTTTAPSTLLTRSRWRVVDIVVASVIGVAMGVVYFGWDAVYTPITTPVEVLLPGLGALTYGVWLIAGVLGGLIVRRPGAAIFAEILAASVEALLGARWGYQTVLQGLFEGLGAELVFLAFAYASWRVYVAILAGAGAGVAMAANDLIVYYAGAGPLFATVYAVCAVISGAVIAGLGSWLIARGLARTGALNRFAAGRENAIRV